MAEIAAFRSSRGVDRCRPLRPLGSEGLVLARLDHEREPASRGHSDSPFIVALPAFIATVVSQLAGVLIRLAYGGKGLVEPKEVVWVVARFDVGKALVVDVMVGASPVGEVGVGEARINAARPVRMDD